MYKFQIFFLYKCSTSTVPNPSMNHTVSEADAPELYLLQSLSELYIIKVIDTIPVINFVNCCIKLVIDTLYSPSLSFILLRS